MPSNINKNIEKFLFLVSEKMCNAQDQMPNAQG